MRPSMRSSRSATSASVGTLTGNSIPLELWTGLNVSSPDVDGHVDRLVAQRPGELERVVTRGRGQEVRHVLAGRAEDVHDERGLERQRRRRLVGGRHDDGDVAGAEVGHRLAFVVLDGHLDAVRNADERRLDGPADRELVIADVDVGVRGRRGHNRERRGDEREGRDGPDATSGAHDFLPGRGNGRWTGSANMGRRRRAGPTARLRREAGSG